MLECFTGIYGSKEKNCDFEIKSHSEVYFQTTKALSPGEGLTIVFGWSKGITQEPSFAKNLSYIVADNWVLFIPLVVFLFMFLLWYKRGKEPEGRGTVIPEYEAPDNLNPAEIGALLKMKVRNNFISATLIDLAHRGFLKIKKIPKEGIFGKEDFELTLLKPKEETDNEFERELLDYVFYTGSVRKMSDLKNKFYKVLPELKKIIMDKLVSEDYFRGNPLNTFIFYLILGVVIFFAGIFVLGWWPYLGFSLVLSSPIVIIFSFFMPQRTKKGAVLMEKILGFKDFLSVTEKDRLKFFNPPTKTPELFEKFLSYAMVLGVEKEWANQFVDIYKEPPQWYSDPSMTTFSTSSFTNSVAGFSSSASGAMASAPSGGSGFGGGGGSGGGGGGGGGGSW